MNHKPNINLSGLGIFKVINATEAVSGAGNEMIKLQLYCIDESGRSKNIFDHLVGTEKAEWKTQQFCISINRLDIYNKSEIKIDEILSQVGACIFKEEESEYNGTVYTNTKIEKYLDRGTVVLPDSLSFKFLEGNIKEESKDSNNLSSRIEEQDDSNFDDDIQF